MDNKLGFKPIPAAIAVGLTLLIWFVIPAPKEVTPQAWHLLALFVGVIAAIIGKVMHRGIVYDCHHVGGGNRCNCRKACRCH